MKLCNAYRLWLQKQHRQGVNEGTDAIQGLVLHNKASLKNESTKMGLSEGPSCWICLEAGTDDSGQPLRRDCACRGESAGFAHLSCTAIYAEHKQIEQAGNHVNQAWHKCPNCRQYYENGLAVDLATKLVAFAKEQYPGNKEIHLEALYQKLQALVEAERKEAEEAANEIISIMGHSRSTNDTFPMKLHAIEADTYNNLARLTDQKGTKDSAKLALAYFERSRDLFKAIGADESVMIAEVNITHAKFKCGAAICVDEVLKQRRDQYDYRVNNYGEEDSSTIKTGMHLSQALVYTRRRIEAERLVTRLSIISERVLGPDHKLTQQSCGYLKSIKERYVWVYLREEWASYQALQYSEDGENCVVQGPISDPRNVKEETKLAVSSKHLFLELGTPIICHGMDSSHRLNGKIGDIISFNEAMGCYEVRFDDRDLDPCMVKRGNATILFDIPDE